MCGHVWPARKSGRPHTCPNPKCRSYRWDDPTVTPKELRSTPSSGENPIANGQEAAHTAASSLPKLSEFVAKCAKIEAHNGKEFAVIKPLVENFHETILLKEGLVPRAVDRVRGAAAVRTARGDKRSGKSLPGKGSGPRKKAG